MNFRKKKEKIKIKGEFKNIKRINKKEKKRKIILMPVYLKNLRNKKKSISIWKL